MKKEIIRIVVFYLLTGLLGLGVLFCYMNGENEMAIFCAIITGGVATIPLHKSNYAAKKVADNLKKQIDETNWDVGRLRLDDFMDNPVIHRQPASVAQLEHQ